MLDQLILRWMACKRHFASLLCVYAATRRDILSKGLGSAFIPCAQNCATDFCLLWLAQWEWASLPHNNNLWAKSWVYAVQVWHKFKMCHNLTCFFVLPLFPLPAAFFTLRHAGVFGAASVLSAFLHYAWFSSQDAVFSGCGGHFSHSSIN